MRMIVQDESDPASPLPLRSVNPSPLPLRRTRTPYLGLPVRCRLPPRPRLLLPPSPTPPSCSPISCSRRRGAADAACPPSAAALPGLGPACSRISYLLERPQHPPNLRFGAKTRKQAATVSSLGSMAQLRRPRREIWRWRGEVDPTPPPQ